MIKLYTIGQKITLSLKVEGTIVSEAEGDYIVEIHAPPRLIRLKTHLAVED